MNVVNVEKSYEDTTAKMNVANVEKSYSTTIEEIYHLVKTNKVILEEFYDEEY